MERGFFPPLSGSLESGKCETRIKICLIDETPGDHSRSLFLLVPDLTEDNLENLYHLLFLLVFDWIEDDNPRDLARPLFVLVVDLIKDNLNVMMSSL